MHGGTFGHWTAISSVTQSCPTLCDPMNRSTPDLPVHHQLPESTQTHVHWVSDAIQPSHPLSSPPPALNLSQNQGLFKWVSSSHQVAKVLKSQLQHLSFPICRPHRVQVEAPGGDSSAQGHGRATSWKDPGPMKNFTKGYPPSSFPKMLGGHGITCHVKPLKQGLYWIYDNNQCYPL